MSADNNKFPTDNEFKEAQISVNRVTRVVKGGRIFRMQVLMVVGDGHDMVGVGVGKASDVASASAKAVRVAKDNMVKIVIDGENDSVPHEVAAKKSGARILLMPAAAGTGLIAGGTVRKVLSVTGVRNVLSKSLGSSNKINTAYATIEALQSGVAREDWRTTIAKSKK